MSANIIVRDGTEQVTTQSYFETLYDPTAFVSENLYAALIAYFQTITLGVGAAENLAGAFLDACRFNNQDPMLALEELKQYPDGTQYNLLLVILNAMRVGTSLLGKTVITPPNKYAIRQVLF